MFAQLGTEIVLIKAESAQCAALCVPKTRKASKLQQQVDGWSFVEAAFTAIHSHSVTFGSSFHFYCEMTKPHEGLQDQISVTCSSSTEISLAFKMATFKSFRLEYRVQTLCQCVWWK